MMASYYGKKNICKKLIKKGAKINEKNKHSGETSLMQAAYKGEAEICELLIKEGADVNIRDDEEKTAIMIAYEKNNKKIC